MTDAPTALSAAISGEDAAIYAYGVLGPHLSGSELAIAQRAELDHRNLRDSVTTTMSSPPTPEVIYELPFPVTDRASALALAIVVEERTQALWRDAVAAATSTARQVPLNALIAGAVRATTLRRAAGARPGTVTFPGLT